MVFQGTFLVGCLELGIGRRWIDTQSIVVFCVFDHLAVGGLNVGKEVKEGVSR